MVELNLRLNIQIVLNIVETFRKGWRGVGGSCSPHVLTLNLNKLISCSKRCEMACHIRFWGKKGDVIQCLKMRLLYIT